MAHRPLLIAELIAQNGSSFKCIAIVDSGADHCVFPLAFAPALGLDSLNMKMQMTGGVGNTANATYYETIKIVGSRPGAPNVTLEFETLVGFTAGMDAIGWGLLGQSGFFEKFPTTLNYAA
jgi:hypothetical protein